MGDRFVQLGSCLGDMDEWIGTKLTARRLHTDQLAEDPFNILAYWNRATVYEDLGYPDLAAMDIYKVMLLVDEVTDESGEFHEEALESLRSHLVLERSRPETLIEDEQVVAHAESTWGIEPKFKLAINLIDIGCLRTAYNYIRLALKVETASHLGQETLLYFKSKAKAHAEASGLSFDPENFEVDNLPDKGYVRREVYPWNIHESDRTSQEALEFLNSVIHPKLEVKATELQVLSDSMPKPSESRSEPVVALVKQLGVFARMDIHPGEEILRERSLLTANNRLHESMCDACSAALPELSFDNTTSSRSTSDEQEVEQKTLTPCSDCDDTVFCSSTCYDLAMLKYHPAICGTDVDSIAKEVPASEAADALYVLLLMRALAIAQTEEKHPLDLFEVKYIWGDFTAPSRIFNFSENVEVPNGQQSSQSIGRVLFSSAPRTLPFTFFANILGPLHILEKMDIGLFTASDGLAEAWVHNTLYAKFRGTASARLNQRTGRPEVAAVHPIWCLANHSCDPNVTWEWAGEICFLAQAEKKTWSRINRDGSVEQKVPENRGVHIIKKGEEVLNHYVDIDLPVQERREWGVGPLGGFCMCERCIWESETE